MSNKILVPYEDEGTFITLDALRMKTSGLPNCHIEPVGTEKYHCKDCGADLDYEDVCFGKCPRRDIERRKREGLE